jgi:hypothetical protein
MERTAQRRKVIDGNRGRIPNRQSGHSELLRKGLLALTCLAAVAASMGCTATTPVRISDSGVVLSSLRAGTNLGSGRDEGVAPLELSNGWGIEAGAVTARAKASQSLAESEAPVVIDNWDFRGPVELDNELDVLFADVTMRRRSLFGERAAGWELLLGVGLAQLDLTVSSAELQVPDSRTLLGGVVGAGVFWKVARQSTVQVRGLYMMPVDTGGAMRLEALLRQGIGRHVVVNAGYSQWTVRAPQQVTRSALEVDFSGPAIGLEIHF